MAEKLMEHWGKGKFKAYSAGSLPNCSIHPLTIKTLESHGLNAYGLRSKSSNKFTGIGVPLLNFVFTVRDYVADVVCSIQPGKPMTAHLGAVDPVAVEGTEEKKFTAFKNSCRYLENHIKLFVKLPLDSLSRLKIKGEINAIRV